jgi:hypothetical protein
MTQVVLSGALPGKNEGLIAFVSPFVPSFWSMNSLSASVDLVEISNISDQDLELRWEAVVTTLTQGSFVVLGMAVAFLLCCYVALVKRR